MCAFKTLKSNQFFPVVNVTRLHLMDFILLPFSKKKGRIILHPVTFLEQYQAVGAENGKSGFQTIKFRYLALQ